MIRITENAAAAIKDALAADNKSPGETYLRVAVMGGGCSGLSYELSFDTSHNVGDIVVEKDGVRVIIDLKSQVYIAGTTLDYASGLGGKGFVFSNPNAAGTCGCGNSFSV